LVWLNLRSILLGFGGLLDARQSRAAEGAEEEYLSRQMMQG
jgi:hypothetical protein